MLDHIGLPVGDYPRSKRFYEAALAPLGYEILMEFGALSEEDLQRWVSVQVEEAVYYLFSWNRGTFSFSPDELPDENQVLLVSLSTDSLLNGTGLFAAHLFGNFQIGRDLNITAGSYSMAVL